MVPSSRPKRQVAQFKLVLTRGGGAELYGADDDDDLVWSADDDEDFREEFEGFLETEDVADILNYLEEVGELSKHEADQCQIEEEFYEPDDLKAGGVF